MAVDFDVSATDDLFDDVLSLTGTSASHGWRARARTRASCSSRSTRWCQCAQLSSDAAVTEADDDASGSISWERLSAPSGGCCRRPSCRAGCGFGSCYAPAPSVLSLPTAMSAASDAAARGVRVARDTPAAVVVVARNESRVRANGCAQSPTCSHRRPFADRQACSRDRRP
eukprot:NODE_15797_length_1030_cov_2.486157.p2 GENE.NODE_15797_length_1030_cov_2.486157~~NODE_15797_length_1030_cov_2.486157.p2  ORF type:complete len:171 (-),score=28.63 NODE_15797_length_1030_cov_2.486157:70-582(-)